MVKFKYDPLKTMDENWEIYSAEIRLMVTTEAQEKAYKKKRLAFYKKYVNSGFQKHFGRDEKALEGWRGICETLGISGADSFPSITRCKQVYFIASNTKSSRVHLANLLSTIRL